MRCTLLLLSLSFAQFGCGEGERRSAVSSHEPALREVAADALAFNTPVAKVAMTPAEKGGSSIERKIVFRASIELAVEDFQPLPAKIEALAKQFEAYVARSNLSGSPGRPRSGQWTVRVPVARYDDFLAAARRLGEVERVCGDSQDVTDEFYDVEATIRNKRLEETRLLKLLETSTGKLEEVLAVERELSRVRGEIEQSEGRMRVLSNLTSLATVDIAINEIKNYVAQEAVTYGTRMRRALAGSFSALGVVAEQASLAAVAAVPWLVVILIPGIPIAIILRSRWRL